MADFVTKSLGSIQAYVVGAPPEAMALFILAVALTVALLVHRVIRRDGRSSSSRAKRPVRPTAADWLELLSPALCGLVALSVFVGALSVGGFYDPKLDGAGLDFLRSAAGPGKAPDAAYVGAEVAARAMWSTSLAAVILAALVVVWIVAGIMLDSERSVLRRWAVFMVLMVVILGWLDPRRGGEPLPLGSKMARDMLNDTWTRNGLSYPGPLTDGLNVFGALLIPLLVFTAFCLLLEPAHFPAEVGSDALRHVAHRWRQLHVLLYVSAAMLTAGVIEVVALYSWSLAPFPGVNEVKIHADICKTSGPASQSVLDEGSISGTKFCMNLAEELDHAEVIDSLRRVVRAHAVTFGAGFSALLASLYAPSVFLLRSRFRRLLELGSQNGVIASDAAVFKKYDLDTDLPGRLVNAVVTLGPLVTGVLSAVITF